MSNDTEPTQANTSEAEDLRLLLVMNIFAKACEDIQRLGYRIDLDGRTVHPDAHGLVFLPV